MSDDVIKIPYTFQIISNTINTIHLIKCDIKCHTLPNKEFNHHYVR